MPRRSHSFARRWVVATALLFALGVLWGLSSPIPSGPDESAQAIKAIAVAHGTLVGHTVGSTARVDVRVPSSLLTALRLHLCNYQPAYPAGCPERILRFSRAETVTSTYVGRYPPLYYALAGLPTLFGHGTGALRGMRVVDGAIVALLLGLAFAVTGTYTRSGYRLLALALGVTPTVLYLGGVVNPSGMEVGGAAALWSALIVAAFDRPDRVPGPVVATAVAGGLAVCASRNLSPAFLVLIVAAVALARPVELRRMWGQRGVRLGAGLLLAGAVASGVYVLTARSYEIESFPIKGHPGLLRASLDVVGRIPGFVAGLLGGFGAPNVFVPVVVTVAWVAMVLGLLAAALVTAPRRDRTVLAVILAVLGFVIPGAIVLSHVQVDGIAWESRYSLPLVSGVPLLAAAMLERARPDSSARWLRPAADAAAVVTAVAGAVASYWLLRRYTVGIRPDRPDAFSTTVPDRWIPPVAAPLLFALVVVATVAWAWWWRRGVLAAGVDQPGDVAITA